MIKFSFASYEESKEILSANDVYLSRLTGYEQALRMKTSVKEVSREGFVDFLLGSIIEWDEDEINRLEQVLTTIQDKLIGLKIELDEPFFLIKTSGREEWNSAYTRGRAIILPTAKLDKYNNQRLERLIIHEIFHLISRAYPGIRNLLYGLLGFNKINEVKLPAELEKRRLTNPDAPENNYFIAVNYQEKKIAVLPVTLLKEENNDVDRNRDILKSITVELLVLNREGDLWQAATHKDKPLLIQRGEVSGLKKQVYNDPEDFFHPEETLAEFFTELVMGNHQIPARLAKSMQKILL